MQHAKQRRSRSGQATQTPVAPAQDAHPHKTALQLGHWALPVPQQDVGEDATRPEENTHVVALLHQAVICFRLRYWFVVVNFKFLTVWNNCLVGIKKKILPNLLQTSQTVIDDLITNDAKENWLDL